MAKSLYSNILNRGVLISSCVVAFHFNHNLEIVFRKRYLAQMHKVLGLRSQGLSREEPNIFGSLEPEPLEKKKPGAVARAAPNKIRAGAAKHMLLLH